MSDHPNATSRPWHGDPEPYCEYIWGPENEMVAQIRGVGAGLPREANAALILEAVNGHEDARKLAELLLDEHLTLDKTWSLCAPIARRILGRE